MQEHLFKSAFIKDVFLMTVFLKSEHVCLFVSDGFSVDKDSKNKYLK